MHKIFPQQTTAKESYDDAKSYINNKIKIVVTSPLQVAAPLEIPVPKKLSSRWVNVNNDHFYSLIACIAARVLGALHVYLLSSVLKKNPSSILGIWTY